MPPQAPEYVGTVAAKDQYRHFNKIFYGYHGIVEGVAFMPSWNLDGITNPGIVDVVLYSGTLPIDDTPLPGKQIPGDCNQDGKLDLSDGICLLGHLFLGSPAQLPCGGGDAGNPGLGNLALLDQDGNGIIGLTDAVRVFQFLFSGGTPHPLCASDPNCRTCTSITGCPDRPACSSF